MELQDLLGQVVLVNQAVDQVPLAQVELGVQTAHRVQLELRGYQVCLAQTALTEHQDLQAQTAEMEVAVPQDQMV